MSHVYLTKIITICFKRYLSWISSRRLESEKELHCRSYQVCNPLAWKHTKNDFVYLSS